MKKTFLYRARLSRQTENNCLAWLETCRQLYNLALQQRVMAWKEYRKSISGYDQVVQLPSLKKAFPEFKVVGSQCLQDVVERLDRAFKAFFRR
jgi:putative transposase